LAVTFEPETLESQSKA